jgi:hypothetical protein
VFTLWPCLALPFTLLLKKDLNAKKEQLWKLKKYFTMHACKKKEKSSKKKIPSLRETKNPPTYN